MWAGYTWAPSLLDHIVHNFSENNYSLNPKGLGFRFQGSSNPA